MKAERCILCKAEKLELLKEAKRVAYVTGDRKSVNIGNKRIEKVICPNCGTVQFLQNEDFKQISDAVFKDYDVVCVKSWQNDEGNYRPQLQVEYERISEAVCLPEIGKMLDIGCGGGESLFQFNKIFPKWDLYGMDIGEQFRKSVMGKKGIKAFFSSLEELKKSKIKFDFITLNHVLSLAYNPIQILQTVHEILSDEGIFFILEADFEAHPWLLYDVEICSFYTKNHLVNILNDLGFEILDVNFEWEKKDIGIFSVKSSMQSLRLHDNLYKANKVIYNSKIEYLDKAIDIIKENVKKSTRIGIFGTSIAGIWLSEIITKGDFSCESKEIFYIEEDEDQLTKRIGVNGYPIYRIEEIALGEDAIIFLPFPKYVADSIKERYKKKYGNYKFVVME